MKPLGFHTKIIGTYQSALFGDRLIAGTVVHFIKGKEELTPEQLKDYARIDGPQHRYYRSVKGPTGVDRLVLLRDDGHYWIAPLWAFLKNGDREE